MKLRHRRIAIYGTAALAIGIAMPGIAAADWVDQAYDENCSPEAREQLSQAKRDQIENQVRRAEANIQAPTPVGELSCLNDLMNAPLAMFSGMGSILGSLQGGLGNVGDLGLGNLDFDVSGMVCAAAASKWSTLTEGLGGVDLNLNQFASMPSDAAGRLSSGISSFMPSMSGTSGRDSSGNAGRVSDYSVPDYSLSDAVTAIPLYPEYSDPDILDYDLAAESAANGAYNVNMAKNFADYLACKIRAWNGWSGEHWYGTPGATCTFDYYDGPTYDYPSTYSGSYAGTGLKDVRGAVSGLGSAPAGASVMAVPSGASVNVAPSGATVQSGSPASTWNSIGTPGN